MKKNDIKRIEEMMPGLSCDRNFKCVEDGFETLCKAKDFGLDNYLECLESNQFECKFAISFGSKFFCQCPIRVFIAKTINK